MATFLWFFMGAAVGSFLNVIAVRYDPDKFLFGRHIVFGRSHCPECKKTLRWFELIPVVSFLLQGGRCRNCKTKISMQYVFIEVLCGLIFIFVPARFGVLLGSPLLLPYLSLPALLWTAVFLALVLMTLIDLRFMLIPDEIVVLLIVLGIAIIGSGGFDHILGRSFLGPAALLVGGGGNIWQNHLAATLGAGAFFAFLVFITKGRGMGIGDVKLAAALGAIFGSPDIVGIILAAFLTGAVFGVYAILGRKKTMKSAIPFGPFLALGAVIVFFAGEALIDWYLEAVFLRQI